MKPLETSSDKRTLFIDQFLLSDKVLPELEGWKQFNVSDHVLYAHPFLELNTKTSGGSMFCLLGNAYDFRDPHLNNADIVNALTIDCSIDNMMLQLQYLSGIFLAIWVTGNGVILIPDLCCLQEAFIYRSAGEKIVVGSTTTILRLLRPLKLRTDTNFYSSSLYQKSLVSVGNETPYEQVVRLRANHYFDLTHGSFHRFYPMEKVIPATLEEGVKEIGSILPGILQAIVHRDQKTMIGLTAGWDSRLLLAASKSISDKLTYYVNFYAGGAAYDHQIPIRLAEKLNLTFMVLHYGRRSSAARQSATTISSSQAQEGDGKIAAFKELFPSSKSVSGGLGEITRNHFAQIRNITGKKLSRLARLEQDPYVTAVYERWLEDNHVQFTSLGYSTLDMFYWEEVSANRVGKSTTDAQAFCHTILPAFNCRYLIHNFLRVPAAYRSKQNSLLYLEIIRALWPEVLSEPINPGFKKRVIRVMQKLHIYDLYRSVFTGGITSEI